MMAESIRESLLQLLFGNWQWLVLGVVAVAALGTLLGALKKLTLALFRMSLSGGEKATAAVLSRRGLRICVPAMLAVALFTTGWLLGASKPPQVEFVASPPQIVTRDVPVVKEVKVPTFIEKIVEVPARIITPAANAKCYFCAALLNVDGVPDKYHEAVPQGGRDTVFRCGGCDNLVGVNASKVQYRFRRQQPLIVGIIIKNEVLEIPTIEPVGKDPIPKPEPPPAKANAATLDLYQRQLAAWKHLDDRYQVSR